MDAIFELKQQMLFLERAHASARMGHFVLDPKRQTIEFSSWVRENIGLNDMPIPIDRLLEIIPEREREQFAATVAEIIEREEEFAFETIVITAKGVERTQRVSGIPAFENQHKREGLIGFYGILQEITSEKEAQRELVAARDKAQAELEARTNILAAVSHEIRTPLGGILGIIDQLKRERSASEQERGLSLVEDSCQVLLDTLDAILQQARLGHEPGSRKLKRFRPSAVAQRVAELFRPLARRKAIQIDVNATSDAEAIGDPGRIQQVLANFVSNSVKFTQAGAVTIYVQQPEAPDKTWTFVVSDTGSGMDANRIERIFEPFDTSGRDSLGKAVGAGLGLSITRDLVDSMGGRIEVESEVGQGSSFTMLLPLENVDEQEELRPIEGTRGTICLALEKATEQIQVEAIASQFGWTTINVETADVGKDEIGANLIVIASAERLDKVPEPLLENSGQILVLGDGEAETPRFSQKALVLPASNLARALPALLQRTLDDAA